MINYIAKIFEFLFKPYWLREYLNDEAIEDIQNLETEGVEDDEYINIKYKENSDICIKELENFLKTMNLCNHNAVTYLDDMVGIEYFDCKNRENELIDKFKEQQERELMAREDVNVYYDSSDSEIEMGFEVD